MIVVAQVVRGTVTIEEIQGPRGGWKKKMFDRRRSVGLVIFDEAYRPFAREFPPYTDVAVYPPRGAPAAAAAIVEQITAAAKKRGTDVKV